MSTDRRPVTSEPVRGTIYPSWLYGLSGTERMHLVRRDQVSYSAMDRLFGFRIGHMGAGTMTVTMPASANFLAMPALEITPLTLSALFGAATTTVPAGFRVTPITVSQQYFRLPRPQPGNLVARARTLNSSSLFVCSAVEVEDPVGRQVCHAVGQWAVEALDPPPPAPLDPIERVEDPMYATPDPPDRPLVGAPVPTELYARKNGLEITRMLADGDLAPLPLQHLIGATWIESGEDEVGMAMPASQWFCRWSSDVGEEALAAFLDTVSCLAMLTQIGVGQSSAALDSTFSFLRPVAANGQALSARGRIEHRSGSIRFIKAEVFDADGSLVAIQTVRWCIIERLDRRPVEPERVLATLLFTDIVGSTERAQRMGDADWRALLGEHDTLIRRELAAHRGREVKTTGDGFLARFESPASAVRCARTIRDGVLRLNLEIRAGVHTGECEVNGADLAGIALHVAARILAAAGPGEILVSNTVKDIAAGSGLRFAPRGSQSLKGVDGEWQLFAVEDK